MLLEMWTERGQNNSLNRLAPLKRMIEKNLAMCG
jgi:hypothetical protein